MNNEDCKLDTEAREFVPFGASEESKFLERLGGIVSEACDPNEEVSNEGFQKLTKILHLEAFPDAFSYIGTALVESSISRSGNAVLVFRHVKNLQSLIPSASYTPLEHGIFRGIHERTQRLIAGDFLRQMADINIRASSEFGDSANGNCPQPILVELLYLIVMCITELYKTDDGQMCLPPLPPCIDLCILADAVFRVHLESVQTAKSESKSQSSSSQASSSTVVSPQSEELSPQKKEWYYILDAFLSRLNQALPYFNLLFQFSETFPLPNSWVSTPCLNPPPPFSSEDEESLQQVDLITPGHLTMVLDKVLLQVKYMMIADDGFPSKCVRSTAIDLLLSGASLYNDFIVCGDNTNDWGGGSDDEDEFIIEGVTSSDKSEVLQDFRNFLASSGQS